MLKHLRIRNFKGWKDTGSIRMAPITLFFGANSSGKSSIGQFLMLLKQTTESSDRKTVFTSGGRTSAVQLGSYEHMVYQHDIRRKIQFEYAWSPKEIVTIKDTLSDECYAGDELHFSGVVGLDSSTKRTLELSEFKYELRQAGLSDPRLSIGLSRSKSKRSEYEMFAKPDFLVRKHQRVWGIKNAVRFYGFPDEVSAYYQNARFAQELNLAQEQLFSSICYLGPLRTRAQRVYTWNDNNPEGVGLTGESAIPAILAAQDRWISVGKRRRAKPFMEIIAKALKDMGLVDSFKVNRLAERRQEYEVRVRVRGSKSTVDIPDVGFGVSQVLPVLAECFYAPNDSIIIIEQPELHLHPHAQSELADVMIDVINSREDGADRNIQLVIETHSEHFLRRLQRRIAEGAVEQDRVAAYFANVNQLAATMEPLQINEIGGILNWPENFFGDEMGDITAQAKAAMNKRAQRTDEQGDSG